jgi:hypothetical protein
MFDIGWCDVGMAFETSVTRGGLERRMRERDWEMDCGIEY